MTAASDRGDSPTPGFSDVVHVWERHDDEDYRRDLSHWRGQGRWHEARWLRLGSTLVGRVHDVHRGLGRPFPPGEPYVVLEWGPGGGANLYALAPFASMMFGVDVSAKNLAECQRQLAPLGRSDRFRPIVLDGEPETVLSAIDRPVDLFVSAAVFQHFPSQEYGQRVLATACRAMAPGAVGYVQIRYDDGTPKYAPKDVSQYRQRHVTATSYPLVAFWTMLAEAGFRPLQITNISTDVNYAAFNFVKPTP